MAKPLLIMREQKTLYGLWAEEVREVQASASVTPLPKPLPYFEGISNYKGNMIPVFSLAGISGREAAGEPGSRENRFLVILEYSGGILGLAVSEVLQVTEDTGEQIPYDSVRADNGVLQISEIIRSEEPVFVLDMKRILAAIDAFISR